MKRIPWLHILLFVLTFFSTLTVGALQEGADIISSPFLIYKGLPFSLTLMFILSAHELSHYLYSKRHKVKATLPYFIPFPNIFGTMGAVIKMKSPIMSKNALMDIGASGPIAGFIISVVATVIGLSYSKILPVGGSGEMITLGDSLLFSWLLKAILGPVPASYDVFLHPVAVAGWIGFFVTSLNLIPVGQLDGGHIAYALLGERHAFFSRALIGVLVLLGVVFWIGWLILSVLLVILGFRHPPIVYYDIPLDPRRKLIGVATLVIFILTFTPVPITIS